jgi:energy-coupling factor transport system ATP-binding protein
MQIEVHELSFSYAPHGFRLQDVCFAVNPGEAVAITGHNGSGKTTLGKLLCGLLTPQSGAVLFDGVDTKTWSLGQRGRRIGYLFQEPRRQLFAPTVREDLTFTQELLGVSAPQARRHATALLQRFELAHLENRGTQTLSRGEQQRLALCGLLLAEGKGGALVLDEPTTGLDGRRKEILAAAMGECLADGTSIVLISHDSAFVRKNTTRELRMEELNPCE